MESLAVVSVMSSPLIAWTESKAMSRSCLDIGSCLDQFEFWLERLCVLGVMLGSLCLNVQDIFDRLFLFPLVILQVCNLRMRRKDKLLSFFG